MGFFVEGGGEQRQEIFMLKGKIESYLKWRATPKTSIRIMGTYKVGSE